MLDLAEVVRGTGARVLEVTALGPVPAQLLAGDLDRPVPRVVIDSRQAGPGDLFVALPGERSDGHQYVEAALQRGASALVAHCPPALSPGARGYLLQVADPLFALQRLAHTWRCRSGVEVVGITGSIGKTTTREIVAAVLSRDRCVLATEGNLNTEIGLPLTLLRLRPQHEVAVLEMGMYGPGEIDLLAKLAAPRIGLVTNVAPIHLERLGSIEAIARAKSELPAALPRDGWAVVNGDNPWTAAMARASTIATPVRVGLGTENEYRALEIGDLGLDGLRWVLAAEGKRFSIRTSIPGRHTLHAFLMAAATARAMGLSWEQIVAGMEAAQLQLRQRILTGRGGFRLIDDSYNAAPMSMNAALDLLQTTPGHKIAVLGDMLELGPTEERDHRELGRRAVGVADWLILRGERTAWLAEAALEAGFSPERLIHAASNAEAAAAVRRLVGSGDEPQWVVLVKGSRGLHLEEVVRDLREAAS